MSDTVLEVRDLHTQFDTPNGIVRAVRGVTFTVRRGETLAIVGESGSGKSVSGLSIMGILPRNAAVTGGEMLFSAAGGPPRDLRKLPEKELRKVRGRQISMIFQNPMSSLNPVFPIGEQIAETLRHHLGHSPAKARAAAVSLLAQVGISDPERRVDAYPHELSGGMRQRAMIALALACDPELLIADEPTTALDVTIQDQIIRLLARLQQERRMSMIFVTHDLKLVAEIADRVAVMYASRVVEEGAVDKVLNRPAHPYTKALLDCIPRRDYDSDAGRTLKPIPGVMPNPLAPPPGCAFEPRCPIPIEVCRAAVPPFEEISPGHNTACLRWRELRP
ncbi:ABC transporter ATP-binding protein [Oceanicola granulosus]|nr:ABC transporter ATP-binding protein [Oceanicola granulosus]